MEVLCAGHVNWDVTLSVDRLPEPDGEVTLRGSQQAGGGSAANVAVNLAGLGVSASVFGSIGTDEPGSDARRELAASGVETHLVRADGDTAVKYLVVDGDGEVMVLSGAGENEAYTSGDLPPDALDVDVLHLTNQPPSVAAGLARRARAASVTVSLAPGRRIAERDFSTALGLADLVFVNDREAAALGPDPWCDRLRDDATLVVTLGSEGAQVRTRADTHRHRGYEVRPLDTTGAGDAFAAGFLAARGGGLADSPLAEVVPGLDATDSERHADERRADERHADDGDTPADDPTPALAVANACGAVASRALGARADLDLGSLRAVIEDER